MARAARTPKFYEPSTATRIVEGLRYGGGLGQWSWLLHRVTGVGILVFLTVHIVDTFFVVAYPALYDHTVAIYGGIWFNGQYYWPLRWGFRLSEVGLIACVLYHAINGVGVILYDLWERGTLYRRQIQRVSLAIFWLIFLPTAVAVLYPLGQAPHHVAVGPIDSTTIDRPVETPTPPR